jgi:hypothetical protein
MARMVQARGAENPEVYLTFSPIFERIWLEAKKLSLECVSQKPAPISACEANIRSPNREPPRQAVKEIGRRRGIPSPRIGPVLGSEEGLGALGGWGEMLWSCQAAGYAAT